MNRAEKTRLEGQQQDNEQHQERDYIVDGAAKVYRAIGEERERLEQLAMQQVFSGTVVKGPNPFGVYVVEQFDPEYGEREGVCTSIEKIEGFPTIQENCIIFTKSATLEALRIKHAPGQHKIVMLGDYVWLYAVLVDVELPPGQSTILGLALEAVCDMMGPVSSTAPSRVHISKSVLDPTEFPPLRNVGGTHTPVAAEDPIGPSPAPMMSNTHLRYSRHNDKMDDGLAAGPKTKDGVVQIEPSACSAAIQFRLLPHIKPVFGPVFDQIEIGKSNRIAATVGGLLADSMTATIGGWGNHNHCDSQDSQNVGVIGQIAVGDTSEVRGGYFVLPGLGLKVAPRQCTLQAVRTTMLQHFTCPHTASEKGRYVGLSIHNSKPLEHCYNRDNPLKQQTELEILKKLKEENITEKMKSEYPILRKLLAIKLRSPGFV